MADEDDKKEQNEQEDAKEEKTEKKTTKSYLPWIIIAVVVVVCAGTGFGLGRLFAGSGKTGTEAVQSGEGGEGIKPEAVDLTATDSQKTWYYDLEPVVANLDEPRVTRYIRVALTLQVSSEIDQKKGTAFFEEKKPLLTNWLTIYLAGLSLEDIRGDRNLTRVQSQILDAFNEKLFPNSKPQIKHILFKEFAVQ